MRAGGVRGRKQAGAFCNEGAGVASRGLVRKPPRIPVMFCPSVPNAMMILPSVAPGLRQRRLVVGHGVMSSIPGPIFLSFVRKTSSPRAISIQIPQKRMGYGGRPNAAPGGMRLSKQRVS